MKRFPKIFDSFFHFPGYMDAPNQWAYFEDEFHDVDLEDEENEPYYYE